MKNDSLFEAAKSIIPGGVNSPVRAFTSVGGTPHFIQSGRGSHIVDVEGNSFLDFVCGWGPLILGHRDPTVSEALSKQLQLGWGYGAPTEIETRLAQIICGRLPSVKKVRLVNSGTEATMSAVRLARGFTGRPGIIKFEGCYHGHVDGLLASAGSGVATFSIPSTPGTTESETRNTFLCPFNDSTALRTLCDAHADNIAAIIVEPIAGNMGVVPPERDFLETLREVCDATGALLIFDEVMTGFRVAAGGAQTLYGVDPDLTTLGKIIGGGLPVGAYGGRSDVMSHVAPEGPVYQAGTLSGNPMAVTAGIATLTALSSESVYEALETRGATIEDAAREWLEKFPGRLAFNRVGSMFTLFFAPGPVTNFDGAKKSDTALYSAFFHNMLAEGFYLPPSQFEACFISLAHSPSEIAHFTDAATGCLSKIL